MNEVQVLQQAREAIQRGDKAVGRHLLSCLLKGNPRRETAEIGWLWLSAIVDDPVQEEKCLQKVLEINPRNELAERHWQRLQTAKPSPTLTYVAVGELRPILKGMALALLDTAMMALVTLGLSRLALAFIGLPFAFPTVLLTCGVGLGVGLYHFLVASTELDRTGVLRFGGKSVTLVALSLMVKIVGALVGFAASVLFAFFAGAASGSSYRGSDPSEMLPSGYSRGEYHRYGATDDDIEFWGLDQPGAPAPQDTGWAVMEMLDELDVDG